MGELVGRMGPVFDRDGRCIGIGSRGSRISGGRGGASRIGVSGRGNRRTRGRLEGNNKVIEVHRIGIQILTLLVVDHHVLLLVVVVVVVAVRMMRGKEAVLILLLLTFETHGHHTPGDVFHAFLVWELGLCAGIETPDLGGQGISALLGFQLIGTIPVGEKRATEQVIMVVVVKIGRGGARGRRDVGRGRSQMGRKGTMAQARHGVVGRCFKRRGGRL